MLPFEVEPIQAAISGKSVRLYFLKLEDEGKYLQHGFFKAMIDKVLEQPVRQGKTVIAIGPELSGRRISSLRIVAMDASGELAIKQAVAEYRSGTSNITADSIKDCGTCDETDCPAWQMLHNGGAAGDAFPDTGTDDLPGAPSWEAIRRN